MKLVVDVGSSSNVRNYRHLPRQLNFERIRMAPTISFLSQKMNNYESPKMMLKPRSDGVLARYLQGRDAPKTTFSTERVYRENMSHSTNWNWTLLKTLINTTPQSTKLLTRVYSTYSNLKSMKYSGNCSDSKPTSIKFFLFLNS